MTAEVSDRTDVQIAAHGLADLLVAKGGGGPLVHPREVFNRFVKVQVRPSTRADKAAYQAKSKAEAAANQAIDILLATIPGDKFIRDLAKLRKTQRRWITVHFRDRSAFPPDEHGVPHESAGYYRPNDFEAPDYEAFVDWAQNAKSGNISLGQTEDLVGNRIYFFGVNEMADTLFHELLHIWFMLQHQTDDFAHSGNFVDRRFKVRLDPFRRDLLAVDKSGRPR